MDWHEHTTCEYPPRALAMRRGVDEWLIECFSLDDMVVRLSDHTHYMVNPTRTLAMPGWQAVMGWHPEEALALQMAFGVVHPELRSR